MFPSQAERAGPLTSLLGSRESAETEGQLPCLVRAGDLWFAQDPKLLAVAQQACQGCPARLPCLSGAISRREPWGVWGGEIFDSGVIAVIKRPRGRPRKADREAVA